MVGGDEATLDECRPILETFGNPVLHLGPLGAGQEAKLLNNTLFTAQLALAAEVFDLAAAARPRPGVSRARSSRREVVAATPPTSSAGAASTSTAWPLVPERSSPRTSASSPRTPA